MTSEGAWLAGAELAQTRTLPARTLVLTSDRLSATIGPVRATARSSKETPMAATATPKKLHNGDWGALAQTATVKSGDTLRITTRSGKQWNTTVRQVLWTGDGKAICATDSGSRGGGVRDGFCDECSRESRDLRPATDSSGIGGYVCSRCYGPPYMLSFA